LFIVVPLSGVFARPSQTQPARENRHPRKNFRRPLVLELQVRPPLCRLRDKSSVSYYSYGRRETARRSTALFIWVTRSYTRAPNATCGSRARGTVCRPRPSFTKPT